MTVLEIELWPRIVLSLLVFGLGAAIGSFLNVVIYRVPRRLSIVRPPSSCPQCDHRIPAWWNIPVLSWLLLRGHCRWCRARIPARYPLVELLVALLALACLWRFGFTLQAASVFVLLAALVAVAWIDWEHMIIPDAISLGFLVLGLALSPFTGPGLLNSLLGALGAGGLLLLLGVIWQKTRGVDGMGGGDIKLMAAVGAFLGLVPGLLVIFLGAFLGAAYGVVLLRKGGQAKVAFGTFLSLATVLVVFFGPWLIDWYLGALHLGR
jgi:leader peptidase (prepilin peptidase)/N-methyltransferase